MRLVQARLLDLGYSEVGEIDGIFGPKANTAVQDFQQVNGLQVDGIVGSQTCLVCSATLLCPNLETVRVIFP